MEILLFLALLGAVASIIAGRGRHSPDQPVTIYLVRPEPGPAPTGGSFGAGLVIGIVLVLILVGSASGL